MKQLRILSNVFPFRSHWVAYISWVTITTCVSFLAIQSLTQYIGMYKTDPPLIIPILVLTQLMVIHSIGQYLGSRCILPFSIWWIPLSLLGVVCVDGIFAMLFLREADFETVIVLLFMVSFLGLVGVQAVVIHQWYRYGIHWFGINVVGCIGGGMLGEFLDLRITVPCILALSTGFALLLIRIYPQPNHPTVPTYNQITPNS